MQPLGLPETPRLGGSVFVNHTSYSGADIKVVVNIYDAKEVTKKKAQELRDELDAAGSLLGQVQSDISDGLSKIATYKEGTPEMQNVARRVSTLLKRQQQIEQTRNALQNRVSSLETGVPTTISKVLAEVQTLSISTHRDKQPVRALGSVYPKQFTRGPRQVAGSLIFTVFDEHVLYQFLEAHATDFDATAFTSAIMDQLPPVDITVAFANEYGSVSRMALYGAEFVNEGQVMSIEDILTENTVNYVARDFDPMRSVSQQKVDENSILVSNFIGKRASDLLLEDEYQNVKNMLDPFERHRRRSDPFI
jgi:hypothetical protein